MRKLWIAALPLIGILGGCGHISGGAAPSTEPLTPGSYREIGAVTGEDCVGYILGLIPISDGNETKDAIAEALKKAPGATALVKVSAAHTPRTSSCMYASARKSMEWPSPLNSPHCFYG